MRRGLLTILLFAFSVPLMAIKVPCGSWVELRATSNDGWHFERWSDDNTDPIRQVEVLADMSFVAFFAPDCNDYPTVPVVVLYDWLLMLNMDSIQKQGYFFEPKDVTWYRVVGTPDRIEQGASGDDEVLSNGYYLTINQSLIGTGDYYALVDISSTSSGEICADYLRSELVCYSTASSAHRQLPVLEPTIVRSHETQRILRLDPNYATTVILYDMSGHRLSTLTAEGVDQLSLQAEGTAGCYQLYVINNDVQVVLRYIVVK